MSTEQGERADATLVEAWVRHWSRAPADTALVEGGGGGVVYTNAELAERSALGAGALARSGVRSGDRVLWCCTATPDSVIALLAVLRLGAVLVPCNPASTPSELAFVVRDVAPSAAVLEHDQHRRAVHEADASVHCVDPAALNAPPSTARSSNLPALDRSTPFDAALIVYTSGTTGTPKGAVHTHASLLAGSRSVGEAWAISAADRLILALPLFHVHGLCVGLLTMLAAGASVTLFERFAPAAVAGAAATNSLFFGVPTMYHRLAESTEAGALGSLRLCVCGSAPLAAELWSHFHSRYGVSVLERYGMSETLLTLSNPLVGERRPGSVGRALPGAFVTLGAEDDLGIGELLVRGPMLFEGYWGRPDATAAAWRDGWFATGDLASVSSDGYYEIRGRRTEMIITGGHNVYPAEVEAVLRAHASVAEVAVVGVASSEWGESVVAFVVGVDGEPDVGALEELANRDLAPFKRPREYRVIADLPKNALGKVLRRELAP